MLIKFKNEKFNTDDVEHIGIKKVRGINPMYFICFTENGAEKLLDTTLTIDELKIVRDLEEIAGMLSGSGKFAYIKYKAIINLAKTEIESAEIRKTLTKKYYLKLTLKDGRVVKTIPSKNTDLIKEQYRYATMPVIDLKQDSIEK